MLLQRSSVSVRFALQTYPFLVNQRTRALLGLTFGEHNTPSVAVVNLCSTLHQNVLVFWLHSLSSVVLCIAPNNLVTLPIDQGHLIRRKCKCNKLRNTAHVFLSTISWGLKQGNIDHEADVQPLSLFSGI